MARFDALSGKVVGLPTEKPRRKPKAPVAPKPRPIAPEKPAAKPAPARKKATPSSLVLSLPWLTFATLMQNQNHAQVTRTQREFAAWFAARPELKNWREAWRMYREQPSPLTPAAPAPIAARVPHSAALASAHALIDSL